MRLLPSRRPAGPADSAVPVVLRARSGGATMIAVLIAAALLLVDAVFRGQWVVLFVSLPPLATIVWVIWILVYHPCIRYDDDALEIVNVGRITRMPWARIADLTLRFQIVAQLDDGGKVVSWGGPTAVKTRPRSRFGRPVVRPNRPAEVDHLLETWETRRALPATGPVTRFWDSRAVVIGAVLGVIVLIEAVVAAILGSAAGS